MGRARSGAGEEPQSKVRKQLESGKSLLDQGKLHAALSKASTIVQAHPNLPQAHKLLGGVLMEMHKFEAALRCFERTLELEESDANRLLLAKAQIENHQPEAALATLDRLADPHSATARARRIAALVESGQFEQADQLARETLKGRQGDASLVVAIARYGLALDFPELIPQLRATINREKKLAPSYKANLQFCIADVLHLQGNYEAAFEAYQAANEAAREASHRSTFDAEAYRERLRTIADRFPLDKLRQDPPIKPGDHMARLLVIIGPPRSGKTLLESQLARHPQIKAGREQTPFEILLQQVEARSGYNRHVLLEELPLETRLKSAAPYQHNLQQQAKGARYVTDTNPVNLPALGYMWASIPESRFIFVHRDHEDMGFSGFAKNMPHMGAGQTDLAGLGSYLGETLRLMKYWEAAIGERAMSVSYDALTGPEGEDIIRQCIEFLGLEWDPACRFPKEAPTRITAGSDAAPGLKPDQRFAGISRPYQGWLGDMRKAIKTALED